MIRNYKESDLEEMVRLWYKASITAHAFVPASFWAAQRNDMKEKYLPLAENFVFEEEEQIKGFISLVGNKICALFVDPEAQRQRHWQAASRICKKHEGRTQIKGV